MKKIWLSSIFIGLVLYGIGFAKFNPFKKESWEKIGKAIEKEGKGIAQATKAIFSRSQACDEMKALGAQWAVKKAEYEFTKISVGVAQKGVDTAQKVVDGTLDVGKGGAEFSSAFLQLGSDAINKGINIKRVYLSGKITDFKKGAFPEFQIKGTAFGKDFNTKLQIDVSKPADMAKKLIKKIF